MAPTVFVYNNAHSSNIKYTSVQYLRVGSGVVSGSGTGGGVGTGGRVTGTVSSARAKK